MNILTTPSCLTLKEVHISTTLILLVGVTDLLCAGRGGIDVIVVHLLSASSYDLLVACVLLYLSLFCENKRTQLILHITDLKCTTL